MNEFFLMYNRNKDINRGRTIGSADQVVITKQNGKSKGSTFHISLGDDQVWRHRNLC